MRIAIILYCLLSAIINVSAAENVTPGKYLCVVSDAVGLQTNASTHQRYGGAIALPPERQKFFITIEETKPLLSEEVYQKIRTQFLSLDRPRAEATLERGQGPARQYQQKRGPLSALPVCGRGPRPHPLCPEL